ncbi:hypothetical protein Tco_1331842 [Tanacetum coccineum]
MYADGTGFVIYEGKQMEEEIAKQVQVEYLIHALKEISQVIQLEYLLPKDLSRRCRRRHKRKLANDLARDTRRLKRELAKLIILKQECERDDKRWSIQQEAANLFEVSLRLSYPEFKDEKSIFLPCAEEEYGDYQWSLKRITHLMYTCIILHNMIRKEKGKAKPPDFYPKEQHREDDPVRSAQDRLRVIKEIHDEETHLNLKAGLVEHIWHRTNAN